MQTLIVMIPLEHSVFVNILKENIVDPFKTWQDETSKTFKLKKSVIEQQQRQFEKLRMDTEKRRAPYEQSCASTNMLGSNMK
jgi:hypothetical protein